MFSCHQREPTSRSWAEGIGEDRSESVARGRGIFADSCAACRRDAKAAAELQSKAIAAVRVCVCVSIANFHVVAHTDTDT